MKVIKLLLILLWLSRLTLIGQTNINNISRYYNCIYIAENYLFQNKMDSALCYYNKASGYRNLFLFDAYNAALVATNSGKFDSAIQFIKVMIQKGISIKYFEQEKLFLELVKSPIWKKSHLDEILPTYNVQLREYIDELKREDQKYRQINNDKMALLVDYKIELKIDSLFDKYGYLSEEMIGCFPVNDTVFSFGWSPLDIILIHQNKLNPSKYKIFFEKSVLEGTLENKVLAMHATNFDKDSSFLFNCFYFGLCDILEIGGMNITCGKELEELMNINRNRIYLPPFSHSINSIKFRLRNKQYKIGHKPYTFDNPENNKVKERIDKFFELGYKPIDLNSFE